MHIFAPQKVSTNLIFFNGFLEKQNTTALRQNNDNFKRSNYREYILIIYDSVFDQ
jgi:hypothetical protein